MDLNSLTASAMREAIIHSLAAARSNRTGPTDTFLDELHRRGFLVVPMLDAEFEEKDPQQAPST